MVLLTVYPRYTSDEEVGSLMTKEWVGVERPSKGQKTPLWHAITDNKRSGISRDLIPVVSAWGESIGLAVCRAIVLSHSGKTIAVPRELLASLVV